MKRTPGRPRKDEEMLYLKRTVSFSPENYKYIISIIEKRQWAKSGKFSTVLNELIRDHLKVKEYKEREAGKHKQALHVLDE